MESLKTRSSLILLGVFAAGCASTPPKPPTPTEMLVSAPWTCESAIGPGSIKTVQTYKPDGTATFSMQVRGSGNGMTIDAAGNGDAKWKLLENDSKMEVTLGALNVTRANLNGMNIDPALAQSMIGPYIAGQSATSAIEITPASMTLTADDAKTTCTRPAAA